MFHTFDTEVAELFKDTNIATLFQNLCYWIVHNKTNEKNRKTIEIKGKTVHRYFTFNSITAFTKQFPYFSKKQIENYLIKLREKGLIAKDTFNQKGFDRTSWYCLVDEDYWMKKYLGNENVNTPEENSVADNQESNVFHDYGKKKTAEQKMTEEMPEKPVIMHFPKRGNAFPQNGKRISPKREKDIPETVNAFPQNGRPIPDINSNHNPNLNQNFKQNTAASVRTTLLGIDSTMILDSEFYPAAANFLNNFHLDEDYLYWFYQILKDSKRINNIPGYFFKVFFRNVYIERYRAIRAERERIKTAVQGNKEDYLCPVCGQAQTVSASTGCCSCCEAPINPSPDECTRYEKLFKMDNSTKEAYIFARSKVLRNGGNVTENLRELDRQYGIVS